jgi:plastocyanin
MRALLSLGLLTLLLFGCAGQGREHRPVTPDGKAIPVEPQDPEPNHGTPGAQDATGGKVDVPIRSGRFTPAVMTVRVGQIVVFTDDDSVPHTVRNLAGGLPRLGAIPVGGRFEFTPLAPGVIRYHYLAVRR